MQQKITRLFQPLAKPTHSIKYTPSTLDFSQDEFDLAIQASLNEKSCNQSLIHSPDRARQPLSHQNENLSPDLLSTTCRPHSVATPTPAPLKKERLFANMDLICNSDDEDFESDTVFHSKKRSDNSPTKSKPKSSSVYTKSKKFATANLDSLSFVNGSNTKTPVHNSSINQAHPSNSPQSFLKEDEAFKSDIYSLYGVLKSPIRSHNPSKTSSSVKSCHKKSFFAKTPQSVPATTASRKIILELNDHDSDHDFQLQQTKSVQASPIPKRPIFDRQPLNSSIKNDKCPLFDFSSEDDDPHIFDQANVKSNRHHTSNGSSALLQFFHKPISKDHMSAIKGLHQVELGTKKTVSSANSTVINTSPNSGRLFAKCVDLPAKYQTSVVSLANQTGMSTIEIQNTALHAMFSMDDKPDIKSAASISKPNRHALLEPSWLSTKHSNSDLLQEIDQQRSNSPDLSQESPTAIPDSQTTVIDLNEFELEIKNKSISVNSARDSQSHSRAMPFIHPDQQKHHLPYWSKSSRVNTHRGHAQADAYFHDRTIGAKAAKMSIPSKRYVADGIEEVDLDHTSNNQHWNASCLANQHNVQFDDIESDNAAGGCNVDENDTPYDGFVNIQHLKNTGQSLGSFGKYFNQFSEIESKKKGKRASGSGQDLGIVQEGNSSTSKRQYTAKTKTRGTTSACNTNGEESKTGGHDGTGKKGNQRRGRAGYWRGNRGRFKKR
ncbi:hypothetical protein BDV3_000962 [Batrachochytrium dendrobatidis]|uniref:Uncharacterized protein n=2 Tax=Batrachochytrium dendrobatidis (strain JEL423) TaxID=403673 RepID=A0A177W8B1_BATDL|nr:hypothetical protein BDEG_20506 [Batrachochytrium dendrobatidis JEL423]